MAKRKKQVIKHTEIQKTESTSVNNVNEEMLSNAITKALLEYDKRKEQEAQVKLKKEKAEFNAHLGIESGKPKFFAAMKLLFRPKKYAKNMQANAELTKLVLKAYSQDRRLYFGKFQPENIPQRKELLF